MLIHAQLIYKKEQNMPSWAVDIPLINSVTQGYSEEEAIAMAVSLVEELIDVYFGDGEGKEAGVSASKVSKNSFCIEAEDQNKLISLILIKQREKHRVTFKELQRRLKSTSPFSYKRYESGKINVSVGKFYKLMEAVAPEKSMVIHFE